MQLHASHGCVWVQHRIRRTAQAVGEALQLRGQAVVCAVAHLQPREGVAPVRVVARAHLAGALSGLGWDPHGGGVRRIPETLHVAATSACYSPRPPSQCRGKA